ncbi:MAG: cytochrome c biogenesis protein ResB, partial [Ottowia sp.]|nr:cytochrome c biogenesis protein ResB [Ottowia sp.]
MKPSPLTRHWRAFLELLASMRFAVALLAVVGIVAAIGTVVPQGEGLGAYINKFGAFWGTLFVRLGLGQVYSAWWFLLILALLVASTALCLVRHTPKHLADMRSMKEHIRPRALNAFGLRAQARLAAPPAEAAGRL